MQVPLLERTLQRFLLRHAAAEGLGLRVGASIPALAMVGVGVEVELAASSSKDFETSRPRKPSGSRVLTCKPSADMRPPCAGHDRSWKQPVTCGDPWRLHHAALAGSAAAKLRSAEMPGTDLFVIAELRLPFKQCWRFSRSTSGCLAHFGNCRGRNIQQTASLASRLGAMLATMKAIVLHCVVEPCMHASSLE